MSKALHDLCRTIPCQGTISVRRTPFETNGALVVGAVGL